jgi:hypothetical protein
VKKFAQLIVKCRKAIVVIALLLCIPSAIGMIKTRVNYDILSYLPSDLDTTIGQEELKEEFGKGAFSFIVVEGMDTSDVAKLREEIEQIDHVDSALWYTSVLSEDIPMEMLPQEIYDIFNSGDSTIIAVFFDTGTSEDETLAAIEEIRSLADKELFVSGASAMVEDIKNLAESQVSIYVAIAVVLALLVMEIFMDNWLVPVLFLLSIAASILLNMGTNYFLGEVSYVTKALAAVLQLAVTMDYSIFLWHAYNEQKDLGLDNKAAMVEAICQTMSSVLGSSITTVAGFIALCFMSFTLGMDLGIVMAKGVILGVIGTLTFLPALILCCDKLIGHCNHKGLLPKMDKLSGFIVRHYKVFLLIMILCIPPAVIFDQKCQDDVYYNLGDSMPDYMDFRIANKKLEDEFGFSTTHMILVDSSLSQSETADMVKELEDVDGVNYVLGLDGILTDKIPEEMVPDELKEQLESENWKLILITSEYGNATDEVNAQLEEINNIIKSYDGGSLLIGEAPLSKDLITTTDRDFQVVNSVSIIAIFVIILIVERSISLPVILIGVIELAIALNMGAAYLLHEEVSFITPICISTIQLGATVDYAILMTTRYKKERQLGNDKKEAIKIALTNSIPSILTSSLGLFAATYGVAMYSDINIISGICMLLARGALISMACVIFFLPSLLYLFDKLIMKTTLGMKGVK